MSETRPWTAKDRDWLRSVWGKLPTACIAARLGRTEAQCRAAAARAGAARRHRRMDDHADAILLLHRRGLGADELGRRLGLCGQSVRHFLRRRGLSPNGISPSGARRRYRRAHGAEPGGLNAVMLQVWQAEAARRGWPGARTPRQADVLDLLCARGPLSTAQVARALGLSARPDGASGARDQLRNLRRLGLVVGSRSPGDRRVWLWSLAPGVGPHQASRERGEGPVGRDRSRTVREPRVARTHGGAG